MDIQGENSCQDTWQVRKPGLNNWSISKSKWGTEPCVLKGKRSLLACHTRCKCSIETNLNSVKFKLGIKVMKLVESLILIEILIYNASHDIGEAVSSSRDYALS